jgi:hypothetical protein
MLAELPRDKVGRDGDPVDGGWGWTRPLSSEMPALRRLGERDGEADEIGLVRDVVSDVGGSDGIEVDILM